MAENSRRSRTNTDAWWKHQLGGRPAKRHVGENLTTEGVDEAAVLWLANSQLCGCKHSDQIRVPVIWPKPGQGQVHAGAEHTVALQRSPRREFRE
jgi:hypothetical protein